MTDTEFMFTTSMASKCADAFVKASREYSLDMREFSRICLNTPNISNIYFSKNMGYKWWSVNYCLQDIMDRVVDTVGEVPITSEEYYVEALFWVGYLYGYWACWGVNTAPEIWKYAPFDKAMMKYQPYHTVSIKEAIYQLTH